MVRHMHDAVRTSKDMVRFVRPFLTNGSWNRQSPVGYAVWDDGKCKAGTGNMQLVQ